MDPPLIFLIKKYILFIKDKEERFSIGICLKSKLSLKNTSKIVHIVKENVEKQSHHKRTLQKG